MIGHQPHRLYNAIVTTRLFTAPANASSWKASWATKILRSDGSQSEFSCPGSRCDRCQVLDNLPVTKVAEHGAALRPRKRACSPALTRRHGGAQLGPALDLWEQTAHRPRHRRHPYVWTAPSWQGLQRFGTRSRALIYPARTLWPSVIRPALNEGRAS